MTITFQARAYTCNEESFDVSSSSAFSCSVLYRHWIRQPGQIQLRPVTGVSVSNKKHNAGQLNNIIWTPVEVVKFLLKCTDLFLLIISYINQYDQQLTLPVFEMAYNLSDSFILNVAWSNEIIDK